MADNTTLASASGGDTIATDDIGGIKYPRSKIVIGADGTNDGDVSSANPLPVTGTVTANLGATDNAVLDAIAASLAGTLTVGSHAVTNAGTFVCQIDGAALTALQLIDNAISGAGFNITQFAGAAVPIGAGVEATALRVTIATDSTGVVSIDDNGGAITVDGTVAATQSGTWTVDLGATDNAVLDAIAASLAGTLTVGSHAVTNAGTFAVQAAQSGTWNIGTVTTVTTVSTVTTVTTVTTVGTVTTLTGSAIAHDSADSGNPHKIGAKATTSLNSGTNVADADRTDIKASVDGAAYVRDIALEDIVTGTPVAITDGSSTSVLSAQGANVKIYITDVIISNSSTTGVTVDLRDGTAGSVKATIPVPAAGASNVGGYTKSFRTPLPFSANTAVAADPSAAASTITVTLIGFKSKV